MSEKASTPDVPAPGDAAAPVAPGGAATPATQPLAAVASGQVQSAPVDPPARPVPSAAVAPAGGAGGWQPPPPVALPVAPGQRRGGLRPSWPLVIGAAVLAAIIAVIGTGLVVGLAVHHRDLVAERGGRGGVYAPYGLSGQNYGGMPNQMGPRMRGGTIQPPQGTLPGNGSGNGSVARGYLGASVADTAQGVSPAGAVVRAFQAGSPAQKAGLAVGDVITAVNGATISDVPGLMSKLATLPPGSTLKLTVSRAGQSMTIDVTTVDGNTL
jgi:hypothetical protein